ncbi:MAG: SDR family NAD(P)-dependent oxidoreductase [Sulfuricaulis sp.]|nr:SDR family NAD(P)-dependent oxidoreductase [Sulfuricaulis sp.]
MKDVLITGGTGSFGRAMVRRLLDGCLDNLSTGPRESPRIIVYSRDEIKQANMRAEFGDNKHLRFFLGDVRDLPRLRRAFEGVDVVIHAAALKRIEVGAYNPSEMVKTNVLGAMNVIEAAQDTTVTKVVALSTDKAYQPISPYGCSKAMAEALFLAANNTRGRYGPAYAVVRYGNVAGSNGSVIPTWRRVTEPGNNRVYVTDPECTRFWMWQDAAVDLVLETLSTMKGGELVIPELPAYRLGDLAKAMRVEMDVIGLPAHEKMHEGMRDGLTSDQARRLTVDELRSMLAKLPD